MQTFFLKGHIIIIGAFPFSPMEEFLLEIVGQLSSLCYNFSPVMKTERCGNFAHWFYHTSGDRKRIISIETNLTGPTLGHGLVSSIDFSAVHIFVSVQ